MRTLSAGDLLHIWEWGQGRSPVAQALVMLSVAYPEVAAGRLADLPIGQRDAQLLALRSRTFGAQLQAVTCCPQCAEALEYGLAVGDIAVVPVAELVGDFDSAQPEGEKAYEWQKEGYRVRFRLPTSADFLAISGQLPEVARMNLLRRCLLTKGGGAIAPETLPEEVVEELEDYIAQQDPQAEVVLNLSCLNCAHQWKVLFDIVSFFWREIATAAQRLLQEVHLLASVYGWGEADILAMSPLRRRAYLNQIAGQTGNSFGEASR